MSNLLSSIYRTSVDDAPRIPPVTGIMPGNYTSSNTSASPGTLHFGDRGIPREAMPAGGATDPAVMMMGEEGEQSTLQAVEYAMGKIAPLSLADTSWDNVGTLLESPYPRRGKGVFLAIDLTPAVCDELLSDSNSTISVAIIYHPCIFKPLKALNWSSSSAVSGGNAMLVNSLLRLSAAGISIYCPHTSLDATPNGLNDWLAFIVSSEEWFEDVGIAGLGGDWTPIVRTKVSQFLDKAGMGRKLTLKAPCTLDNVVQRVKKHLRLRFVQVAQAQPPDHQIETIAVCAGSGGSILKGVLADLYVTGEMSHHELLEANSRGISVILLNHSNSERGYLEDVLVKLLGIFLGESYDLRVSTRDRDPLVVM